jgi:hypothetical protein
LVSNAPEVFDQFHLWFLLHGKAGEAATDGRPLRHIEPLSCQLPHDLSGKPTSIGLLAFVDVLGVFKRTIRLAHSFLYGKFTTGRLVSGRTSLEPIDVRIRGLTRDTRKTSYLGPPSTSLDRDSRKSSALQSKRAGLMPSISSLSLFQQEVWHGNKFEFRDSLSSASYPIDSSRHSEHGSKLSVCHSIAPCSLPKITTRIFRGSNSPKWHNKNQSTQGPRRPSFDKRIKCSSHDNSTAFHD